MLKLNQKLASASPYFRTVSRILLSPEEYRLIHEVTSDPFFEGGNLCRTTRADLILKLSTFE